MTSDKTIYIQMSLIRIGTGPQTGQTRSTSNYVAYYGPEEFHGPNKDSVIKSVVTALRKHYASGTLSSSDMPVPGSYDDMDKYTVPAEIIMQHASDIIDMTLIKRVPYDTTTN